MRGSSNAPAAQFEAARLAASQRAAKTVAQLDSLTSADAGPSETRVRTVNGHRFVARNGRWIDEALNDSLPRVQVQVYSNSYFALLQRIPELRSMAALGGRVVAAGRETAIEFVESTPELTAAALDRVVQRW